MSPGKTPVEAFTDFLLAHNTVHEMTHLWWIASTNEHSSEVYSFLECIELAWDCDDEPAPGRTQAISNADSYHSMQSLGIWLSYFPT